MSLSGSFADSNGCGSDNFTIVEGDQRKQKDLQSLFRNVSDRQGSVSRESEEEAEYYLPRSSPVISRRQEKKMDKLPLLASKSVDVQECSEETLEKVRGFSCSNETSSKGISKLLLLETHCSPAALRDEKYSDNQRNLSGGSSESQYSSWQESGPLNFGASQLEKGNLTSKGMVTGAEQTSEAFHRNSVDLDQENAHFVVVDMVLEVVETAKWAASQKHSDSFSSTDSGYEELCDRRLSSNRSSQIFVHRCSAEILAQSLLVELERWWISSEELLGEFPLATASTATGNEASLSDEILQKSRMRGTLMWTPPQFQIISSITPTQRRSDIIASQQYLCAGCGTQIEPRYMKRLLYCDYLGKYFCNGCHGSGEAIIPARVLSHWDFGRYPVCQFSKQLLESIWEKPLFNVTVVGKTLYSQAKELQKFREVQEQLISIKKLLKACRLSEGVLADFQQLPSHLFDQLHVYSMDDLIKIKRGHLVTTTKAVLRSAINHVEACELCQAKGFICEFCRGNDVLFPFQTDICKRCPDCRACFHTLCFRDEACPKCARLQIRRAART